MAPTIIVETKTYVILFQLVFCSNLETKKSHSRSFLLRYFSNCTITRCTEKSQNALFQAAWFIRHGGSAPYGATQCIVSMQCSNVHHVWFIVEVHRTKVYGSWWKLFKSSQQFLNKDSMSQTHENPRRHSKRRLSILWDLEANLSIW